MDILAEQIRKHLAELDVSYEYKEEEQPEFVFPFTMNHIRMNVRIGCYEENRFVIVLAYCPLVIPSEKHTQVLYKINKLHAKSYSSAYMFLDREANMLVAQSVLNVGTDLQVDYDVFRCNFSETLHLLDDTAEEFMQIILSVAKEPETQVTSMDVEELAARAAQGEAEAQYRLGISYYKGEGLNQDFGKAIDWVAQAAMQQYPGALELLGVWQTAFRKEKQRASDVQDFEGAATFQARESQCAAWIEKLAE